MNIYSLQSSYQPSKHRIVKAVYEADVFKFDTGTLSPFSVLTIDELDPVSKSLCFDLIRTCGRVDLDGENKYHINAQGALIELIDWVEAVYEII